MAEPCNASSVRPRREAWRVCAGSANEPNDWKIWYDLAVASVGAERRQAFLRAQALNPLSPTSPCCASAGTGGLTVRFSMFSRDPSLIRRSCSGASTRMSHTDRRRPTGGGRRERTFERAVRYRQSYDRTRDPDRLADWHRARVHHEAYAAPSGSEDELPMSRRRAILSTSRRARRARGSRSPLGERDRELVALRYGADLSARQIAAEWHADECGRGRAAPALAAAVVARGGADRP